MVESKQVENQDKEADFMSHQVIKPDVIEKSIKGGAMQRETPRMLPQGDYARYEELKEGDSVDVEESPSFDMP